MKPAARAATGPSPRMDFELPHAGEQHARVVGVHGDVRGAGILVDEEHLLPGPAAIRCPIDPALLLGPVAVPHRGHEDDVWVARIDDDARDAAGAVEAHVAPRLSCVSGSVDAIADGDVAANECLAGAGPDDVGV